MSCVPHLFGTFITIAFFLVGQERGPPRGQIWNFPGRSGKNYPKKLSGMALQKCNVNFFSPIPWLISLVRVAEGEFLEGEFSRGPFLLAKTNNSSPEFGP